MELIRTRKPKLSIDMAPLIDVVFQLLVFFMLTSTFANPAMKLDLPKAMADDNIPQEHIVVSIDQEGALFLNDTETSMAALKADLQKQFAQSGKNSVHVRGDQNMPYHYFVEVMDVARQAGAQQVNIVHQRDSP